MLAAFQTQDPISDALDDAMQAVSRAVALACSARAVCLWLSGPNLFGGFGADGAELADGADLTAFLSEITTSDWRKDAPEADTQRHEAHATGHVLWTILAHDAEVYGLIAIDVSTQYWDETRTPKSLFDMAPLVAMVVANGLSRFQLEADLAEVSRRADVLARKGEIDPLTALENKASFEAKCTARLGVEKRPAAMLALDLDDFKHVNDAHGHLFGDRYLAEIARALSVSLPPDCIIGRTGGDEFCFLIDMPEAGHGFLNSITRDIRQSMERAVEALGTPDLGGVSIGVSLFPQQATNFDTLLGMADCALYASKRRKRNCTTIYSSDLDELSDGADLRDGRSVFQFDRLDAQVQPIIDIETGRQTGLEILARWRDRDGNLCLPDSFNWVFRDHRYASQLTFQVVETALEQLCVLCAIAPQNLPDLWINITEADFLNVDFVFDLQSILERYGVAWEKIVIEVNEDTIIGPRNGVVLGALTEIRCRGGRVALDDFGAGQTGLNHACQWPVDIIKIDRSMLKILDADERASVFVEAIVMVANRLGQIVLAEGIETERQLLSAARLGCRLAQGFHFAAPMDAKAAMALELA